MNPVDGTRRAVVPAWTLACLCGAAFLVFVQTFMVAPLIPHLTQVLHTTTDWVGLAVPAYIVPEAIATLAVGPLSDRIGRRGVIIGCLFAFIILTLATATATGIRAFIGWRIVTGIVAAGIVPIGLSLIGDLFPFAQRGRAVGWLFGAIAGGTAAGAAAGALLEPVVGWRGLFIGVAALSALLLTVMLVGHALPRLAQPTAAEPWSRVVRGYGRLLSRARGRRTYAYVFLNAVLQSGIFTWLGVYLHQRFALGETGIGLTLLGYGIPGLLFGPLIGRFADRHGRALIIPAGVALTGLCALVLALPLQLVAVQAAVILLSLGFDLTHPQLAAITTDLGGGRGQSVALMAFSLFSGFGIGSLVFQAALAYGFGVALVGFGTGALLAATAAVRLFRSEGLRPLAAAH